MRNINNGLFRVILLGLLFVGNISLFAKTIYVSSSTGNDENDGMSEATPVRTLGGALEKGGVTTYIIESRRCIL